MIKLDEDKTIKAIGERLKSLRIKAGYTSYVNFAIENDLDRKQYWRLEAGEANFTIKSLLRVLNIHELTLQDFFSELES